MQMPWVAERNREATVARVRTHSARADHGELFLVNLRKTEQTVLEFAADVAVENCLSLADTANVCRIRV
jgi:hypothetical protein